MAAAFFPAAFCTAPLGAAVFAILPQKKNRFSVDRRARDRPQPSAEAKRFLKTHVFTRLSLLANCFNLLAKFLANCSRDFWKPVFICFQSGLDFWKTHYLTTFPARPSLPKSSGEQHGELHGELQTNTENSSVTDLDQNSIMIVAVRIRNIRLIDNIEIK